MEKQVLEARVKDVIDEVYDKYESLDKLELLGYMMQLSTSMTSDDIIRVWVLDKLLDE